MIWGTSYLHAEVGVQLQRPELLGSLRGDGQPHQCHLPPLHVPLVPGDTHLPRDGLLQVR